MKLFEVLTTEHNGRQEYWGSHLVATVNLDQAWKRARKYFKNWYEDSDKSSSGSDDPDRFKFVGGSIVLEIDAIKEITFEDWIAKQIKLNSIGKLPKAHLSCKRCKALLNACEHIRDCLDVGGEQSRQFADEITYLKKTIKINRC